MHDEVNHEPIAFQLELEKELDYHPMVQEFMEIPKDIHHHHHHFHEPKITHEFEYVHQSKQAYKRNPMIVDKSPPRKKCPNGSSSDRYTPKLRKPTVIPVYRDDAPRKFEPSKTPTMMKTQMSKTKPPLQRCRFNYEMKEPICIPNHDFEYQDFLRSLDY